MKRSFKNSIIILLSLCVLAGAALIVAFAVADETPSEVFDGVKLSESGDVCLRFIYSSLGEADSVSVTVSSPTGELKSAYTVALEDISADEDGKSIIPVRLAVVQMTDTVTVVTKKDGRSLGKEHTYSVRDYADKVLADNTLSEYHSAIRAILNAGAMAQMHFDVNTDHLANDGLYRGNTNPIDAVADINCNAPYWTDGDKLELVSYEVFLESKTTFRLYFTYSGDAALSATVSREGIEEQDTKVYFDEEKKVYYVRIKNIAPTLYAEQYTLKVTDGSDTLEAHASVLNYLDSLIALDNAQKAGYINYGVYDAQTPDEVETMKGLCDTVVMSFEEM